ncbi:magnesium transporter CorA family protein [Thermovibrio ammonificans]|uniref:Mg2 transporter protein CorA family protein n=1 Tax=Thermovibrio ammonificans (strain DSM 15698 / JCM 12110 / HB-1) TaxID=648996 RepID=E8T3T2_THEA1|nr:magnesium transporter CorA family protein [Thermovibrio ammonificans]ADU97339.1 Mg2 transporter protein CorA family protein [Thermovibrio ammonificans HB-1]
MENVAWIVTPSGDTVTTVTTPLSTLLENRQLLKKKPLWIHLRRLDEKAEELLTETFDINELSVEDCRTEGRSKVENFDTYLFLLLIYYDGGISRHKRLCAFWGKDFLITVGSRRLFEETKKELLLEEKPFGEGIEHIVWLFSSIIVEKLKRVTDILEEQADEIEAKVFKEQNPELLEDISDLSYEILTLRRTLKQIRDTYKHLLSYAPKLIHTENIHYFRDLLDEISILYDRAETLHEFIQNVLDVFSSLVSFKLNEIMKTLTIFVAVLEPLMFISSFYGMNVEDLPFAQWRFGIVLISLFMAIISIGLIYYFKRKRWI